MPISYSAQKLFSIQLEEENTTEGIKMGDYQTRKKNKKETVKPAKDFVDLGREK